MVFGIWAWIVLFAVLGALLLWRGMKGNDNRSCLARFGTLVVVACLDNISGRLAQVVYY